MANRHNCFNSRAPRGARQVVVIYIDAPGMFQFTCPSRSTTYPPDIDNWIVVVSIHVPLAEHDKIPGGGARHCARFNSRAPRGARHLADAD